MSECAPIVGNQEVRALSVMNITVLSQSGFCICQLNFVSGVWSVRARAWAGNLIVNFSVRPKGYQCG